MLFFHTSYRPTNSSSSYLRTVPLKYQQLVAKKDYLEAAMLVSTAMSQLVREDVLAVGTALVELIQAIVDAKFVWTHCAPLVFVTTQLF